MNSFLEIISKIADNEGVTITKLERDLGASKGVFSRALSNNTDIQSKWILKIIEYLPEINPDWLLTGRGEMLRKNNTNNINSVVDHNNIDVGNSNVTSEDSNIKVSNNDISSLVEQQKELTEILKTAQEQLSEVQKQVSKLLEQQSKKDEQISKLIDKLTN